MLFRFDEVFEGSHQSQTAAYYTGISPLIRQAIAGEDCLAVFCGPAAMNISSYLLSSSQDSGNSIPGLLTQAASQLLLAANSLSGERKATVTLSWYRIDCSGSESIIDILRTASDSKLAKETTSGIISTNPDQLVMREQGRGRGMVIPGLWEVELATTSDIEAVVQHVIRLVLAADHGKGDAHTVFQLTYSCASGVEATTPALSGRISFVIFSDMLLSSASTGSDNLEASTFPWVQHLLFVMDWIDQKHAAPPFHKSRLLLLLRDLICGRQLGSIFFLTSHPTKTILPKIQQWLQLINRIHQRPLQPSSIAPATSTVEYTQAVPSHEREPSRRRSSTGSLAGSNAVNATKPPLSRRSSSISPSPSTNAPVPIQSHSLSAIFGRANSIASQVSIAETVSATSSSRPASPRSQSLIRPSSPSRRVSIRDALRSVASADRSGSLSPLHAALRREDSVHPIVGSSYIQHEEYLLLKSAFDSLQSENDSLRQQLAAARAETQEHRENYQQLIEQLKEEGSMLEKRDQDRYRAALQEIRDYEVYKEVMEATMVKMTNELNDIVLENKALKQQQSTQSIQMKKQKAFDERYSRDLTLTKKKLVESEQRVQMMQQEMKKLAKERDHVLSESLTLKAELKRQPISRPLQENDLGNAQLDEVAVGHIRELEQQIASLTLKHQQEIATVKSSHGNVLEQLMQYQEENRLLKSTLGAVLDADASNASAVAPSQGIPHRRRSSALNAPSQAQSAAPTTSRR